jgi:hypothetical protein
LTQRARSFHSLVTKSFKISSENEKRGRLELST